MELEVALNGHSRNWNCNNTGGGGGGGGQDRTGGTGGSGVVILSFLQAGTITFGAGLTGSTTALAVDIRVQLQQLLLAQEM
jgi:hypothetical protein